MANYNLTQTGAEVQEILDKVENAKSTPVANSSDLITSGGVYESLQSKQNKLTFDIAPTEGSTNPASSGGIYKFVRENVAEEIENIKPIVIDGNVDNAPDEEDLTSVDQSGTDVLKFKDKAYAPLAFSGLGRKYLRKNITGGKNVLTSAMVADENTIYHIQYEYDLNEQTITLPAGCTLSFEGGSLSNGTLVGELNTPTNTIDAADLGCVYNSQSNAASNTQKLKVLEGITNEIHLVISGTLYLGSGTISIANSIHIDGKGNNVYVSGFGGFSVIKNAEIANVSFIGDSIYESGGTTSRIVTIADSTSESLVSIHDCSFSGNIRVLHSARTTDSELTKYISDINVYGNTFNDIACTPSSEVFRLGDTNFENLIFENNNVHNFMGLFINCGITNDTSHSTNIANFAKTKGRRMVIRGNYVFNDLDFKPWENVAFYQDGAGYYAFVLGEIGDCFYEKNFVQNIISNYSSTATYDAYLSVTNITYSENTIKNCVNLTGAYNQLLKSKGSTGVTKYIKNNFIVEDLSESFPNIDVKIGVLLKDMEANVGNYCIVTDNTFNVHIFNQADGYKFAYKKLIFNNNYFKANYIDMRTSSSRPSLLGGVDACDSIDFENNTILFENFSSTYISYSGFAPCLMFSIYQTTDKDVQINIKNNYLKNCIFTGSVYKRFQFVGEISGNTIEFPLLRYRADNDLIVTGQSNRLVLRDNFISQETSNQKNLYLCQHIKGNEFKMRTKITTKTTIKLLVFSSGYLSNLYSAYGGLFKVVAEIFNHSTQKKTLGEVNFQITESNSTYTMSTIKAYNDGGVLVTISSASWLFNHATPAGFSLYLHPTGGYLSIPSSMLAADADLDITLRITPTSNINQFDYKPTSGTTAKRPALLAPTDAGFKYFDTTLGKPIYAKTINSSTGEVTWVDSTGAAV